MSEYDYTVPLDEMPKRTLIGTYDVKGWLEDHYEVIEQALRLAHKMTQKNSEENIYNLSKNEKQIMANTLRKSVKVLAKGEQKGTCSMILDSKFLDFSHHEKKNGEQA
jgi:hypothetical protein